MRRQPSAVPSLRRSADAAGTRSSGPRRSRRRARRRRLTRRRMQTTAPVCGARRLTPRARSARVSAAVTYVLPTSVPVPATTTEVTEPERDRARRRARAQQRVDLGVGVRSRHRDPQARRTGRDSGWPDRGNEQAAFQERRGGGEGRGFLATHERDDRRRMIGADAVDVGAEARDQRAPFDRSATRRAPRARPRCRPVSARS